MAKPFDAVRFAHRKPVYIAGMNCENRLILKVEFASSNSNRYFVSGFESAGILSRAGSALLVAFFCCGVRLASSFDGSYFGFASRHLRTDFLSPSVQPVAEFVDFVRHLAGQIVLFADVVFQVVKLNPLVGEKLDQFEVAFADRAVRSSAAFLIVLIVGIVPE